MPDNTNQSIITGIDIVYIPDLAPKVKNHSFLKKAFHPSELKKLDPPHIAGIFAAKESVLKALDLPPGSWLEMEVRYKQSGKPFIALSGQVKKRIKSISISISHDNNYEVAQCVAVLKEG